MDSKKKFASAEQKLRLIHLVEADPQLKSGKFSSTFTKTESKRRWIKIADDLNSITGANKTWEEWRKTWQDRKANAKKKFAAIRKQANLTGGGPPPDPPTLEESLVLSTFDQPSLVGHNDSQESLVNFFDLSNHLNVDENSPSIIDLASGNSEGSLDQDATPKTDSSQIKSEVAYSEQNILTSSQHENITKTETLQKTSQRKQIIKPRRPVAQRRLEEGLQAAQALSRTLEEKNLIKKKFYEDFLKLMTVQVQALADIASSLKNK